MVTTERDAASFRDQEALRLAFRQVQVPEQGWTCTDVHPSALPTTAFRCRQAVSAADASVLAGSKIDTEELLQELASELLFAAFRTTCSSWSTRPTSMSGGPSTNQHQAASFRPSIHCPFSSLLTSFVEVPFWFIWSDKPAALLVICLRTLKPADSELLLTCAERWEGLVCHCHRFHCGSCRYLTAPYIRVPLLLGFFADRERVSLLREPLLQASS